MNKKLLITTSLIVLLVVAVMVFWNPKPVVSQQGYELAIATYSACLAKSEERLSRVEDLFRDSQFSSELTESERRWFERVIAKAKSDQWEAAAKASKKLLNDQVND